MFREAKETESENIYKFIPVLFLFLVERSIFLWDNTIPSFRSARTFLTFRKEFLRIDTRWFRDFTITPIHGECIRNEYVVPLRLRFIILSTKNGTDLSYNRLLIIK